MGRSNGHRSFHDQSTSPTTPPRPHLRGTCRAARDRYLALVHAADGRAVVDHRDLSRRIPRPLLGGTAVVPEGVRVWDAAKLVAIVAT